MSMRLTILETGPKEAQIKVRELFSLLSAQTEEGKNWFSELVLAMRLYLGLIFGPLTWSIIGQLYSQFSILRAALFI